MNNLKDKRIFIKNNNNNLHFDKNDGKKYLISVEMKCDNELKISYNNCNDLFHNHENSQFYKNDVRLTFNTYIESMIRHIDSNNENTIKIGNNLYNLHLKNYIIAKLK